MTDYCTIGQIKAQGRLDITTGEYDPVLASLATTASRWIDQYCCAGLDNAFAAVLEEESETGVIRYYDYRCTKRNVLYLDAPLLQLVYLANADIDVTAIESTDYRLMPRNLSHYREIHLLSTSAGWVFDTVDSEIQVGGVWGLTATPPRPVTEAAAMLAGWLFKRYQTALADATANQEIGQIIYGEAMPKQVASLLEPYRVGVLL